MQNNQSKPASQIQHIRAYIDLYEAKRASQELQNQNKSIYKVELSGSLLSPISFETFVKIDDQKFVTVDNIEEHLIRFYYKNYSYPKIPRLIGW